jgi:hypothetical protein
MDAVGRTAYNAPDTVRKKWFAVLNVLVQPPSRFVAARHAWAGTIRDGGALLLLAGLALALYWPIFAIRPLAGDNLYVLAWVSQATARSLVEVDPAIYPEWRPLAYLTIWLEHRIVPLNAVWIHHGINLVIWAICSALVYLIVKTLAASRAAALVAAMLVLTDPRLDWVPSSLSCERHLCSVFAAPWSPALFWSPRP